MEWTTSGLPVPVRALAVSPAAASQPDATLHTHRSQAPVSAQAVSVQRTPNCPLLRPHWQHIVGTRDQSRRVH
eukprot:3132117-Rhodomonas_salina.2